MSGLFNLPHPRFFPLIGRDLAVERRFLDLGLRRARRYSCPVSPFRPPQRSNVIRL